MIEDTSDREVGWINWRYITHLLIAAFFLICLLGLIYHVSADESNVTVYEMNTTEITPTEIPRLQQGDTVHVGDTVDISGVVPPYPELAYWDGYGYYDTKPSYKIEMGIGRNTYYNFYVDPDIFTSRTGKWYKYNDLFESNGNNLAFEVSIYYRNKTLTFPNGTVINQSELIGINFTNVSPTPTPTILPVKHESDYLITTEESFNVTIGAPAAAMWLFNNDDNTIFYAINDSAYQIIFDEKTIGKLEPGNYKIILQYLGDMTPTLDVVYNQTDKMIHWFDRKNFRVQTIDTTNMVPEIAVNTLSKVFPETMDQFKIRKLSVQRPEITINHMQQVWVGNAKEYYHDPDRRGNVSLMDVRGYTNVKPGVNVSVILDEDRAEPQRLKYYTYHGVAQGDYLGDWRQYQIYVPLYWDSLEPGMHNLKAQTALGGFVYADFFVGEEPKSSYVPSDTVRWVGDRNPWVPTPTPEIIKEVATVTVVQTVPVPVTPSIEQVAAAQKVVDDERWAQNLNTAGAIVVWLAAILSVGAIGYYLYTVYRRGKQK